MCSTKLHGGLYVATTSAYVVMAESYNYYFLITQANETLTGLSGHTLDNTALRLDNETWGNILNNNFSFFCTLTLKQDFFSNVTAWVFWSNPNKWEPLKQVPKFVTVAVLALTPLEATNRPKEPR